MYKHLYDNYRHWQDGRALYFYSDPHFADPEMPHLRKNYIGDEEQVKRINRTVGKGNTIVILGDVANKDYIKEGLKWVKKIRGYKVLIMGNHDQGQTIYKREIRVEWIKFSVSLEELEAFNPYKQSGIEAGDYYRLMAAQDRYIQKRIREHFKSLNLGEDYSLIYKDNKNIFTEYDDEEDCWKYAVQYDNRLFDEVYEGTLTISPKIMLSHEPAPFKYCFNFHGHDHSNWYKGKNHINFCAEHINYTPVAFNEIVKSGRLKDILDIHREVIDNK